jgi:hypothetical protein
MLITVWRRALAIFRGNAVKARRQINCHIILSDYLIRKNPMKNFIGFSAIAGKIRQSTYKISFLFDFQFKANV